VLSKIDTVVTTNKDRHYLRYMYEYTDASNYRDDITEVVNNNKKLQFVYALFDFTSLVNQHKSVFKELANYTFNSKNKLYLYNMTDLYASIKGLLLNKYLDILNYSTYSIEALQSNVNTTLLNESILIKLVNKFKKKKWIFSI